MSKDKIEHMTLTTSPAIHVGPIITPGSNETISIVIPLSAQLTTLSKTIEDPRKELVADKFKDQCKTISLGSKDDKTKGCPFPNCNRYGRAFSRAHDLKRHIVRHKIRKERLPEVRISETCDCNECEINFIEDYLKSQSQRDEVQKNATCKKFIQERNLETLSMTSDKNLENFQTQTIMKKLINDERIYEGEKYLTQDFLQQRNKTFNRSAQSKKCENGNIDKTTPVQKLRCDYCWKVFKTKWTLSSHVAAHEGRFQFDCSQCGKKFVRKSHYEGHVRSHEATRPYICSECGKTFKELKHQREHTKRKHSGIQNAVQSLLNGTNLCMPDKVNLDQAKFTILMPINIDV